VAAGLDRLRGLDAGPDSQLGVCILHARRMIAGEGGGGSEGWAALGLTWRKLPASIVLTMLFWLLFNKLLGLRFPDLPFHNPVVDGELVRQLGSHTSEARKHVLFYPSREHSVSQHSKERRRRHDAPAAGTASSHAPASRAHIVFCIFFMFIYVL